MINMERDTEKFLVYCDKVLDLGQLQLPREYRYESLVACVLDAVYSIGVRYKCVQNVITRYHEKFPADPSHTLSDFIGSMENMGIESFTDNILKNHQRTKQWNYAKILVYVSR